MRVLYLYAHPLPESFHAAIREEVRAGLREGGHEVDLCDLYAEGFDPVLSAEERRGYHAIPSNRAPVEAYIQRVERAEALVLSFPTWSFGLPAILKGFFDRVFVPGVSFVLQDGVARPNLTQIRRIAGISTYGRPRWNAVLVADPPRMAVTRYLRALTGWRASVDYHALYDMNRATDRRCSAFLAKVRREMARF
ncbi:NAD(P)H-dependent oxidoreductase [Falsiroseomonas oryzae]|uniref:NAD(P)H-dependent oxidoreductase n=1 Tax=Falsiroseomonas oryzae TaxID=2766473 RepID=UPI0022EB99D1|nr:NAD(P)H-dependent oxidoreductase [Roseomonas sp. MO-31]